MQVKGHRFKDWVHAETGMEVLKAQHPEFELWSQGIHAKSGVACADCHMPYKREGALKVSEHWVRSPLLEVNRSCETCHPYGEQEIKARVEAIQDRHYALLSRAGQAAVAMLDAMVAVRRAHEQRHHPELAGRPTPRRGASCCPLAGGGGQGPQAQGARRAPARGAVAARLRGGRELDGLSRAPGDGPPPRRVHRSVAAGAGEGGLAAGRQHPGAIASGARFAGCVRRRRVRRGADRLNCYQDRDVRHREVRETMESFCYQCEQTVSGKGCTATGNCGKDPETSVLQDLVVHAVKGVAMYAHRAARLGSHDDSIGRASSRHSSARSPT